MDRQRLRRGEKEGRMKSRPQTRGTNGSKWRGVLVVVGGVLIHLSLGTLYCFGNLNPYLTSYMRWYGSAPDLNYTESSWCFALAIMVQGLFMVVGGLVEARIGPKLTCLLGGWTMSLGVALTYFSIKHSFYLTAVTYGVMFGLGIGCAYAVPLNCCMQWFPERKGLVNGFVVAGFGGGAFIFNFVQTSYINPDNLSPEKKVDGESYFIDVDVLQRVPSVFLILAGCYFTMQLLGSLALSHPPPVEDHMVEEEESEADSESTEEEKIALRHDEVGTRDTRRLIHKQKAAVETSEDINYKPSEMLRSKYFYMLWFMFLLNGQGSTFISSLYKAYGQKFIKDDTFLAVVGAFAAIFNAGGRIWWGFLADRSSFRVSMLLAISLFTCLMLTLQLTSLLPQFFFLLWVCLLFGAFSASFSLFPTAIAKCFGRKHLTVNYGLLFTSQVVTAPLGVFLTSTLIDHIGWSGLFFLVSGFTFTSMCVVILFSARDRNNEEI